MWVAGRLVIGALIGSLMLPAGVATAQSDGAFSPIGFSAGGVADLGGDGVHDLWRPAHGVHLRVSTPFYAGEVAVTVQVVDFEARGAGQPDFRGITRVAEWSAIAPLAAGVRAFGGMQVGAFDMVFRGPMVDTGNADENELLVGAQAGVRARVAGPVSIVAMVSRRRVLTNIPIDLGHASVAIQYTLETPGWIREALQ